MEKIEVKSEGEVYEDENVITSDNLFSTPYNEQSIDEDDELDDSQDFIPNSSNSTQAQNEKRRGTWFDKDCQLLINLYKEENPKVGKTVKTKRMLWGRIAKKMQAQGSSFGATQIEAKFKCLKRAYNNNLEERKHGGRRSCPYHKDFAEIMGHRSITPTYQLGSTEESGIVAEHLLTDSGFPSTGAQSPIMSIGSESPLPEEEPSVDDCEESAKPPKNNTTILEELQKWREEFILERNAKKEYRQAKLLAYEKRTAVLEKEITYKQDLLTAFKKSQNRSIEK